MNGDGIFNAQILVDKLTKLNCSQQSIENYGPYLLPSLYSSTLMFCKLDSPVEIQTSDLDQSFAVTVHIRDVNVKVRITDALSHWCIFHRNKAKQVVETWERQFHCSPREQRVSFLYLANDILQNSRRKGMEFVGEFWRVLPYALNDVIENSDEFGRKAALRLVDIWEERKVFSPRGRGQNLKEDFLGRNKNGKSISYKLKQSAEDMLEKLILSYRHASNGYNEDALLGNCRAALSAVEKVEKKIGTDFNLGRSGLAEELQVQRGLLRECIEQLTVAESCRATLKSHLREALNEQEFKVEQLRTQLQVAQVHYEQVGRLLTSQAPVPPPLPDQNLDEIPPPPPASAYSEAPPPPDFPPESPSAAGIVQNLTSSSAQMLTYVLSSLASEGVVGNNSTSEDYISPDPIKRPRFDNGGGLGSMPCYLPQPPPPPLPLFPHLDSMHQPTLPPRPLTLSSFSPPLPSYGYGSAPMQPTVMPGYPMAGVPSYPGPPNPNHHFHGSDGSGYIGQPPFPSGPQPISRQ